MLCSLLETVVKCRVFYNCRLKTTMGSMTAFNGGEVKRGATSTSYNGINYRVPYFWLGTVL